MPAALGAGGTTAHRFLRTAGPWLAVGAAVLLVAASQSSRGATSHVPAWVTRASYDASGTEAIGRTRPTPTTAASATPLGVPQAAPADPGAYAFVLPQLDSGVPVRYDPCRPIPYVVNERTLPPLASALVADAVAEIQAITGLQFVYEGTTDELVAGDRSFFQPERYGDRWAPVLITWSDPAEIPGLAGDVAGSAGSAPATPYGDGPTAFVSGMVALDGPHVRDMYASLSGRLQVRGLVRHELGHLVGLDHVDDPAQLMHGSSGTVDFQPGDLAGLVQLGAGPCVTKL